MHSSYTIVNKLKHPFPLLTLLADECLMSQSLPLSLTLEIFVPESLYSSLFMMLLSLFSYFSSCMASEMSKYELARCLCRPFGLHQSNFVWNMTFDLLIKSVIKVLLFTSYWVIEGTFVATIWYQISGIQPIGTPIYYTWCYFYPKITTSSEISGYYKTRLWSTWEPLYSLLTCCFVIRTS